MDQWVTIVAEQFSQRLQQMKLSQIVQPHQDNQTDKLYQPLRKAIQAYSPQFKIHHHIQTPNIQSDVRKSTIKIATLQPDLIKQTTLIAQNMRLVQTNNPLKRFKARSRSYRAISMEQRVGTPINNLAIQQTIVGRSKKEIVYDYEPGEYQHKQILHNDLKVMMNQSGDYRLPARTRSATQLLPIAYRLANRVERVQHKTIAVQTKQSQQISMPSTKASIQLQEQPIKNNKSKKSCRQIGDSIQFSDYYQDCKRYTFDGRVNKANEESGLGGLWGRGGYKYNLLGALDQPANTNCVNGLCTKNEIITIPDIQLCLQLRCEWRMG